MTAVCFFGEIRGTPDHWKKVYDAIVAPNHADVFMSHTIYDKDFLSSYTPDQQALYTNYYKGKGVHYYPPRELLELFKPKGFHCSCRHEYPLNHYDLFVDKVNPINSLTVGNDSYDCTKLAYYAIMNQHDTRASVIALKQAHEQKTKPYDTVILTRLDINPIDTLVLHKPSRISAQGQPNYINEQILYGPSSDMNVFTKLLDQMPDIYANHCSMEHHFMQNEHHMYKFLEKNGIPLDYVTMPLSYHAYIPNGLMRFTFSFQ